MNLTAPGAGFLLAFLQKLFKAFQIPFDPASPHTQHISDVFGDTFRIIIHLDVKFSPVLVQGLEMNDADVSCPTRAAPGNLLIGDLFENLSVPFPAFAANVSDPMKVIVVELSHLFDTLHESWKLLELRPLIVDVLYRGIDFNTRLNTLHKNLLAAGAFK